VVIPAAPEQAGDFEREARFVAHAYELLDRQRARIQGAIEEALELPRGGTHQARLERDITVDTSLQRLARLDVGDHPLVFGRIDLEQDETSYHIGRLALADEHGDPCVVDWRAPVAEGFYRATARNRMGVVRRWHLDVADRKLVSLEREDLVVEDESEVMGRASLLAALERPRGPEMVSIVETIQADQDELIRRPLNQTVVIEGSPGTGKTAIALHRAAYLLYTYRWRLDRQGVLVIGPSEAFVRYVRAVLPSLGESGVEVRSVPGLREPRRPSRGPEDAEVAQIKGDARMARVLAKAVRDRERPLRKVVTLPFGSQLLLVTPELSREAVMVGRRAKGRHNQQRRAVEEWLAHRLASEFLSHGELSRSPSELSDNVVSLFDDALDLPLALPEESSEQIVAEVATQLRRELVFQRVLARIWPRLTAEEVLYDLLTRPPLLRLAARAVLSEEEQARLLIAPAPPLDEIPWSDEDLTLLDELDWLLGGQELQIFGHVILDEAQEISPMAARAVRRRASKDSFTVLGDRVQGLGPFRHRSWEEVLRPLGVSQFQTVTLHHNYRSPRRIGELAGRIRAAIDGQDGLGEVVIRRAEGSVNVVTVSRQDRDRAVADVVRGTLSRRAGSVGVVVVGGQRILLERLRGEICPTPEVVSRVWVDDVSGVKGLEFDSVVLTGFEETGDRDAGLRSLYVAATRATQELILVVDEHAPRWISDVVGFAGGVGE